MLPLRLIDKAAAMPLPLSFDASATRDAAPPCRCRYADATPAEDDATMPRYYA